MNQLQAGDMMSTFSTMSNAVQTLHTDIINILKADTNSLTATYADGTTDTFSLSGLKTQILDGVPVGLIKGTGFPYIIVHTPEVEETRLSFSKHKIELNVHIEIITRREGQVRILTDAVKDSLQNSQNTTKADGYCWYGRRVRSNLNYIFLQGELGNKPVWHMNLFISYLWVGS